MYVFKVELCERADAHSWASCPYAHEKEKARRRDPARYRYASVPCPDVLANAACPRGDGCPYTHSIQGAQKRAAGVLHGHACSSPALRKRVTLQCVI